MAVHIAGPPGPAGRDCDALNRPRATHLQPGWPHDLTGMLTTGPLHPGIDLLYGLEDRPPLPRLFLYGMQWVFVALPN